MSHAAHAAPTAIPAALAARDEHAAAGSLEAIFREHAPRILRAAVRVTGSAHDAEDVLQTVFLRVLRRERGAFLDGDPGHYLRRAAINAGLDVIRARHTERMTAFESVEPVLADERPGDPERASASGELRALVRRALADESPRNAEIFALRYFEGYDNHEIARMVGASRNTVNVILHRVRKRLRETLRPHLGDES